MDEIEKFKKSLGPVAKGYNEVQLRQLHREMRQMAQLLLDIYLYNKRQSKRKTVSDLTDSNQKAKIPP